MKSINLSIWSAPILALLVALLICRDDAIKIFGGILRAPDLHAEIRFGFEGRATMLRQIPLRTTEPFEFPTGEYIRSRRISAVKELGNLISSDYEPRNSVYGGITDRKAWIGDTGNMLWGPGPNVVRGNSVYSLSILNPLLLVEVIIDDDKLNEAAQKNKALRESPERVIPQLLPIEISLDPASRTVHEVFNLTEYVSKNNLATDLRLTPSDLNWFLSATNAKDFGGDFFEITPGEGTSISGGTTAERRVENEDRFLQNWGCYYPGECILRMELDTRGQVITIRSMPSHFSVIFFSGRTDTSPLFTAEITFR